MAMTFLTWLIGPNQSFVELAPVDPLAKNVGIDRKETAPGDERNRNHNEKIG